MSVILPLFCFTMFQKSIFVDLQSRSVRILRTYLSERFTWIERSLNVKWFETFDFSESSLVRKISFILKSAPTTHLSAMKRIMHYRKSVCAGAFCLFTETTENTVWQYRSITPFRKIVFQHCASLLRIRTNVRIAIKRRLTEYRDIVQ